jgi:2-iminobutanoate/2-iminopropanoate deaminase
MTRLLRALCGTALALIAATAMAGGDPVFHAVEADRPMPFSDAVEVGDLLILSGKLGIDPATGKLVPGGIGPETRQTLENIKASLQRYGSGMDRVVKCTVFLADITEWAAMNEVYVTFFPENPPARSALGSSGLALNARTEIECMAAR